MAVLYPAEEPQRRQGFHLSEWFSRHMKLLFVLPALIFVLAMMVFPIGYTTWLSFNDWNGSAKASPKMVGLDNYVALLTNDDRFRMAVLRTFSFSIAAVVVELVLGLLIALLLQGKFFGQNLIKTLMLLPMVATPVAMGMAWLLMYEPTIGFFNSVLRGLHLPPQPWLGSEQQALWSLVFVDVWQWTPMMALIILAGLTVLPEEPFEAARVDGANSFQRFFYLTLPLLAPTIVVAVLLRSIDALKTFDIIYTMTRGGPGTATETINTYGYVQSFEYFNLGRASSLLVIFFAIVLGISLLFIQIRKRWGVQA
ncbi:MAG TPA: sugar ABC transporter permease [Chloroflexia bacterium]|nr:sugar ABC transporter permease [Chloroflexia bacterium]